MVVVVGSDEGEEEEPEEEEEEGVQSYQGAQADSTPDRSKFHFAPVKILSLSV